MSAPHADQLIDGYLARLTAAAADFPGAAREELLLDMRSHIAEARAREAEETDATILNILDRLGEPAVVVAEARERLGLSSQPVSRRGLVEIAAIVLLPFIWILAVILLWWSPAWRVRDKIIGTVFSLGGYPWIFYIVFMTSALAGHHILGFSGSGASCVSTSDSAGNVLQTVCSGPSVLDVIGTVVSAVLLIGFYLLPLLTAVYLAFRLRWGRRVEAVPAPV